MQTFYENQTCADRRTEQNLSYRMDFCWSTFANGGNSGEDSSFYDEDDRFEPYTSDESDSVLKGVPNGSASQDITEAQTYLQAQYNNGDFESMHKCPIQPACLLNLQPSMETASGSESSGRRQANFCPSTKRRLDIERRNSRERIRVRAVNEAFVRLRRTVPATRCSPKRVSKRSTLVRAAEYIRELQQRLADASFTIPQHKSTIGRPTPPPAVSIMMKIDKL